MEIERRHKKETTWVIKRKDQPGLFVLKSEEESEIGSSYTVNMKQADVELNFKMNREEFLNFISILNGFKDVVLVSEPDENLAENKGNELNLGGEAELKTASQPEPQHPVAQTIPEEKTKHTRSNGKSGAESDLDPTEWDPF